MKKFSFTNSKPPIRFYPQNSLQFGRRARRSGRGELDISSLEYIYNEVRTYFIENLWRYSPAPPVGGASRKPDGLRAKNGGVL